jgi:hypothetical protein
MSTAVPVMRERSTEARRGARLLRSVVGTAAALAGPLLAALLLAAVPADAQQDTCQTLAAQLARLDKAGGALDPLADALLRQRAALERGIADYQRVCGGGGFPLSAPSAQCPAMQARIGEMQQNLAALERRTQRGGQAVQAGNTAGDRARILTAMRQNGCGPGGATAQAPQGGVIQAGPGLATRNGEAPITTAPRPGTAIVQGNVRYFTVQTRNGPQIYAEEENGRVVAVSSIPNVQPSRYAPPQPQPQRQGGLISTLFGEQPPAQQLPPGYREDPYAINPDPRFVEQGPPEDGQSYRTLCVRMCDGYYFPISHSTTRSRFGLEADLCRARCPGAETRLYAHRTSEDSETAVSADDVGEPYTKLPNAMKYRTQVVSGCGCGRADPSLLPFNTSSEEGGSSGSGTVKVGDVRPDLPIPVAKPERDQDPDTAFNELANFVPAPLQPKTLAGADGGEPERRKPVRVVGPKFYENR